MTQLRIILITKMERPKEVLITEDEHGNIVKQTLAESYNAARHQLMCIALRNCTALDPSETRSLMFQRLKQQGQLPAIHISELNTLCWAIGAVSGALPPTPEKEFLVHVVKELLQMCNKRREKNQKAVIASCIMYVMGQYPRFLRARWRFLKTVVNKLFEFMHESFPGMKQMAVETFATIASSCAQEMVRPQSEQVYGTPLIYEVMEHLEAISKQLEEEQLIVFFEAMGKVVAVESDVLMRSQLVQRLLSEPNKIWETVMAGAEATPELLVGKETVPFLTRALRLNVSVAKGMGPLFEGQMGFLYEKMLLLFHYLTNVVSGAVDNKGVEVLKDYEMKKILIMKSEIIKLFTVYIKSIREIDEDLIVTKFVPALYEPVLRSYVNIHPLARDHNVLSLFKVLIEKTKEKAKTLIQEMFRSVIKSTLEMIKKNFSDFPDHRVKFYSLLKVIVSNCFSVVMELNDNDLNIVLMAIIWALKHQNDEISRLGLETIEKIIENLQYSDYFGKFYKNNLFKLIVEILTIATDSLHSGGYELQTKILAKLFFIVQNGDLTFPLYDPAMNFSNNRAYIQSCLLKYMGDNFESRLTNEEAMGYAEGFIRNSKEITEFKEILNDFRLQIKEFKR